MTTTTFPSAVLLSGFFCITNGSKITVPRPSRASSRYHTTQPSTQRTTNVTYYMHYDSVLQCRLESNGAPFTIRMYSPPHQLSLPDSTIVYLMGRACTDPSHRMVEAYFMEPIPGDPTVDPDYDDRAPDVEHPTISVLGRIIGSSDPLPGGGERCFVVKAFSLVCNEMRTSQIKCVLENTTARWNNLQIPPSGTTVFVTGRCRHLEASGNLAISVDEVTLNIAPPPLSSTDSEHAMRAEASSSGKRKRFHAMTAAFHAHPTSQAAVFPSSVPAADVVDTAASAGTPADLGETEESTSATAITSDSMLVDACPALHPSVAPAVRSTSRKGKGKGSS